MICSRYRTHQRRDIPLNSENKLLRLYPPPRLVTQKPSDKLPLQIQASRGLYSEITLKFNETKQKLNRNT